MTAHEIETWEQRRRIQPRRTTPKPYGTSSRSSDDAPVEIPTTVETPPASE